MAITATLCFASANRLCYRVVATAGSGEAAIITGANLLADTVAGVLKAIAAIKGNGYGKLLNGQVITTAQARALWCSDDAASVIGSIPKTASIRVEQRAGTGTINADADTDTDTQQCEINIVATAAGAASAYLWLEVPGAIG